MFMHDQELAHGNINFDSLLLTKDLTLKLCSFGAQTKVLPTVREKFKTFGPSQCD